MKTKGLELHLLEGRYAVSKLERSSPLLPGWAINDQFLSITLTRDELSIVSPEDAVPAHVRAEKGWRCIKVAGPLDFSLTGILASLLNPLAEKGISIFAVSTYDTDYLLVKEENLAKTLNALSEFGHRFLTG
jgi:hypothetical protein